MVCLNVSQLGHDRYSCSALAPGFRSYQFLRKRRHGLSQTVTYNAFHGEC